MNPRIKSRLIIPTLCILATAALLIPAKAIVENQMVGFFGADPVLTQPSGASQAAVGSQTGYVTTASLKTFTLAGRNGAGALTVTGLAVGDTVKLVTNLTTPGDVSSSFESTVTVVNQLQQSAATNFSAAQLQILAVSNSTTDISNLKTLANALRSALVSLGLIKGSA